MSRLIRKNKYGEFEPINHNDVCDKLGQLEDLMEKYNINELWELEMILDYYEHRYDDVQTRRKE